MRGRLYAQLAALSLPILAGGCVQMTRHSNMMIFGTNTVVGVRAGTNATSVPEVAIGYTRQEAVVLPLVANVGETSGGGLNANRLTPCDLRQPVTVSDAKRFAVHPCSLVGLYDKSLDSYSVLASFGGNFSGTSGNGTPGAKAGIAQYFATGIAAQLLAVNGGAAVVATGDAARESAEKMPVTLAELTPGKADYERGELVIKAWQPQRDAMAAKVRATAQSDLQTRLADFEGRLDGPKLDLFNQCKTVLVCAQMVDGDAYLQNFNASASKFEAALNAWP